MTRFCSSMKATSLPDLPKTTRTLNSNVRPKFLKQICFRFALYKTYIVLPYPDEKIPPLGFLVITRDHGH